MENLKLKSGYQVAILMDLLNQSSSFTFSIQKEEWIYHH